MCLVFKNTSLKMKFQGIALLCFLFGLASSAPNNSSKIINGFDASITDYNYQAYIVSDAGSCGGAILTTSYVITAAHCLQSATTSKIQIRVGSNKYNQDGTTASASSFTINPNYNQGNKDYDAAIIKLKTPLTTSSTIGTITPATVNPEVDTNVVVTGWGSTSMFSSTLSSTLKGTYMNIKSKQSCQLTYPFIYTNRMICASRSSTSTCTGDDGGPVVSVPSKQLVGIVMSSKYCITGINNIFTSVASISDWISSIIG